MSRDLFKKITKTALGISAVIWLLRKIRLSINNPTVRFLLTILVLFAGFTYTKYFALEVYKEASAGTLTFSRLSEIAAGQPVKAAPVSTSLTELRDVLNGNVDAENLKDSAVTSAKILDGAIVNADISASAAIAYSKLSLTNSILNADISSSAGIVYSKLALTDNILNADINSTAAIATTKMAFTSDVSGDRDNSIWGFRNSQPTGITSTTIGSWTDFDCDTYWGGTIPASKEVLAILYVIPTASGTVAFRPNGTSWAATTATPSITTSYGIMLVATDTDHIIEYYATVNNASIYFLGYVNTIPK